MNVCVCVCARGGSAARVCALLSWHNHLNPDIKKTPWTEDEDRIILERHAVLGNQWAKIAEYLPGR